jgi:hypothetical protein
VRLDAVPAHFLIIGIKGEVKSISIGQPVVMIIVPRCGVVRLVMGLKEGFVAHKLIGFAMRREGIGFLRHELKMARPRVLGWYEANDDPHHGKHEDEESNHSRGVHEDLQAGTI